MSLQSKVASAKSSDKGRKARNGPGKQGKTKEAVETAPIFLRKTYHMIDTCDPRIATWSDDGLSFVVKDTQKFAADIIGQFFKHNKFSSFVRQLNFYGFRKIKSDPIRIRDVAVGVESKHWKFRHDKFQRGRPGLLAEIRKTSHTEAADKNEVEALKKEVAELRADLSHMSNAVVKLTALVEGLTKCKELREDFQRFNGPAKKRRLDPVPNSVPSGNCMVLQPPTAASSPSEGSAPFSEPVPPRPGPETAQASPGLGSTSSLTSAEEEILASLFASDAPDEASSSSTCSSADLPDIPMSLETKDP